MCSVVSCARVSFRNALFRQISPVCLTNRREKHVKTRVIIGRVKPIQVVGKSSTPIPDHKRRVVRERYDRNDIDEDFEDPSVHVNSSRDLKDYLGEVKAEFKERAGNSRRILTKKEVDPQPVESNLLHWEARQQIRYLHKQDPLEWSPEKIAEEFPISVNGAKRLLRSNYRITEDRIGEFNREVDARWKLLRKIRREGTVPDKASTVLHQKTIELYLTGDLQSEDLKAGNPEFPRAPPQLDIKVPYPVGREGKHFAILQEYTNLLKDKTSDTRDEVTTNARNASRCSLKFEPRDGFMFEPDGEIGSDPEAATHLDLPPRLRNKLHRSSSSETMTIEDFKREAKIRDAAQIEGEVAPTKVIRKKNINRSARAFVNTQKHRDAPKMRRDNVGDDGTHSVGRNVLFSDGEVLYRKSRH